MQTFSLDGHDHITLTNLLKITGCCDSGAAAKHAIEAGEVMVDGEVELRKQNKLKANQVVSFAGLQIKIVE